jgi:glutamate/tyrosine decarboxylase-like PLP-dependent enzyme
VESAKVLLDAGCPPSPWGTIPTFHPAVRCPIIINRWVDLVVPREVIKADGAMVIIGDREALAEAMNADAAYSTASADAQKNLNPEFSRRARDVPVWAALRTLGRQGVAELVERDVRLAQRIADGLRRAGYVVLNRVVLNQVLAAAETPADTVRIREAAQASGQAWFGSSVWNDWPAFRISVSSWRTTDRDADDLVSLLDARDVMTSSPEDPSTAGLNAH